jgi:gliding motility-associated lipoprotein GldH
LTWACKPTPFYTNIQDVDPLGWSYDNKKSFTVEVTDTMPYYDMHLNVTHSTNYSYQNMYMKVTTSFPNTEDKTEQLNIDVAEKNGNWIGKCSDEICQIKVYLLEKFKFADQGTYTFSFEQDGRDNPLLGVKELQLDIIKAKE